MIGGVDVYVLDCCFVCDFCVCIVVYVGDVDECVVVECVEYGLDLCWCEVFCEFVDWYL